MEFGIYKVSRNGTLADKKDPLVNLFPQNTTEHEAADSILMLVMFFFHGKPNHLDFNWLHMRRAVTLNLTGKAFLSTKG